MMECVRQTPKLDDEGNPTDEYVETISLDTLNSLTPIWKKNKNDVTKEEMNEFYKNKFYDYLDPLDYYQYSVEGNITYTSLLFIPKKAPYDLYSNKYE